MNPETLEQVAKMLRAQLRGTGHLWWIGGYVYGVTGNGDPFVLLYPADEKLQEKVVRVYPHDFRKLPAFIPTDVDSGDTEANPNKEQARKKGIYHECPMFEVVTFDGKETQMGRERRFGDVLRLSRKAAEEAAAAQRQPAQGQRPSGPPPPPPPGPATQATLVSEGLPDYRAMAAAAKTVTEFDYAAFMVLRNGLFTDQERIAQIRELLAPAWKPGPKSNAAMLAALGVYREKRSAAEGRGEAARPAHEFARTEARSAYNREIS